MNIYFQYNPYTLEAIFEAEENENVQEELEEYLQKTEGRPLQTWVHEIPSILFDIVNDDCTITFRGTMNDFEDVRSVVRSFNAGRNNKVEMDVVHQEVAESEERLEQLEAIFEDIQRGPFDELKEKHIAKSFRKVLDSEVEVAVVATMSSGKSTVINAMLGKDLMPTRNEATTASITRITHAAQDSYEARPISKEGDALADWKEATLELMDAYNDDEEVFTTELRGPLRIQSKNGVKIALVDTPGPNNSQDASHRKATFDFIKSKEMPLILYVLNATQLGINDDAALLRALQREMDTSNIQAQERFIFAVNKIDALDSERESVEHILANAKKYLQANGIENPRIFPITAKFAQLLRMDAAGESLGKKDARRLKDHEYLEEDYQLVEHAMSSEREREVIEREIEEARQRGEEEQVSLFYTGVPPLEKAIESYFEKYALLLKVNEAWSTFKNAIESCVDEQKVRNELNEKKQRRAWIEEQLEIVQKEAIETQFVESSLIREKQMKIERKFTKQLTDSLSPGIAETHRLCDKKMFEVVDHEALNEWLENFEVIYQDILFEIQEEIIIALLRLEKDLTSSTFSVGDKQFDISLSTILEESHVVFQFPPMKFTKLETDRIISHREVRERYQEPIIQNLASVGQEAKAILSDITSRVNEEVHVVLKSMRKELKKKEEQCDRYIAQLKEMEMTVERCQRDFEWLQQMMQRLYSIGRATD